MTFTNKYRKSYYGIRVGDIVNTIFADKKWNGSEVIELDPSNNNGVYIKNKKGETTGHVAEWLKIVTKVEDRK